MSQTAEARKVGDVEVLSALLRRCLESLDSGMPEYESDYETAVEKDAVLVAEIRSAIAS